jgi:outer membrane receptor protein involved in Fe transport
MKGVLRKFWFASVATIITVISPARGLVFEKRISIEFDNKDLSNCLSKLEQTAEVRFYYDATAVQGVKKLINKSFTNSTLKEILQFLLENTNLEFEFVGDTKVVIRVAALPQKKNTEKQQAVANLKGHVYDAGTHEAIPGAIVFIPATKYNAVADQNGAYSFADLVAGTYFISARSIGYDTSIPQEVTVSSADSTIILDIYLKPSTTVIDEVVVKGLLNKETNASARRDERIAPNVINIISANAIQLLPDQSVADIMQRVSGVSMTKSSYGNNSHLVIRGMPSRYNSALVDGVVMPSSSTSSREVNLDLFGANLVSRVEVIKSVTPDLESDAIGGTVNIKTKQAPDTSFLNMQFGSGYNQYYFTNSFLTFDNSTVVTKDFSELYGPDYLAKESEFPRQNLIAKPSTAIPNLNFDLSAGRRFFNKKFSIMATASGQTTSEANTYVFNSYVPAIANGKPAIEYVENQEFSARKQRLGGYVKLNYRFNDRNSISFFTSLFRVDEQRVREYADHQTENGGQFVRPITTQTQTDNSALFSNSIRGEHNVFRKFEVDWTLLYAVGNSQSPDFANVDLAKGGNDPPTLNYTRPVVRNWQHNEDLNRSGYVNIKFSQLLLGKVVEFKTGGMYRVKTRNNYANEYFFQPYDDDSPNNYKNFPNPDLLTVPLRNNQNDQEQKGNAYLNPGNFTAREDIGAAYAMATTTFGHLYMLTGVRFESTYLHTEHNQNNIQFPVAKATQQYNNFFPSLHLTYRFSERQNLRFSVYRALNRPNFVEVIPYNNPRAGTLRGNPDLKPAYGNSVDMRYEIYPRTEDVFSAGVFYKRITNAIEDIIAPDGGTTPRNVATPTTNYGFELVAFKQIRNFSLSANYTYTKSVISDKAIDFVYQDTVLVGNPVVNYERTLVGQSPHLFNLSLSYFRAPSGFKSSVTYTLQGLNLSATDNTHLHFNRYQATYHNLGLSFEQRLGRRIYLSMKVSNLLNSPLTWFMKEENNALIRKSYNYQVYYFAIRCSL